MSRTKTSSCKCGAAPHDSAICPVCLHHLAHHFNRRKCKTSGDFCRECAEHDAKYGDRRSI